MISIAIAAVIVTVAMETALAATGNTLLDEQFCQNYYTLDDKDNCPSLRSKVRSEVRGEKYKTPTLEMGDKDSQPAMVFLHGWPDTAALWANQFAEFCGDDGDDDKYFCVAPSWIDFHPDYPPADESNLLWSTQVDAFHDVIVDLNLTDVTFVIFDFGAYIGYQLLYKYPDRIGRVIALDIGMETIPPVQPYEGMEKTLPEYQQNNIEAFLNEDDEMMQTVSLEGNWPNGVQGFSPCNNCTIAPNTTIGVGAKTGWPYYNFVRMDYPWTSFFDGNDVPLEEWEFDIVPSFPSNVPILFLYSSDMFLDDGFLKWIDDRGVEDGKSHREQMADTDHWMMTRIPKEINNKIAEWITVPASTSNPATTSVDVAPSGSSATSGALMLHHVVVVLFVTTALSCMQFMCHY